MILYSWLVNHGYGRRNEEGFAALLQRDGSLTVCAAFFDTDQTIGKIGLRNLGTPSLDCLSPPPYAESLLMSLRIVNFEIFLSLVIEL